MSNVDWVYASGSAWISFDPVTQMVIETLWQRDQDAWINTPLFHGPVYVDTTEMTMFYSCFSFTIARRANN